jgi:hypothetical protein
MQNTVERESKADEMHGFQWLYKFIDNVNKDTLDMIQRLLFLWALLLGVACTNALHFYLDANEKRCFIEEIPTDTVVEGH